MHRQYHHKRQSSPSTDPFAVPSADGLDGNGITAGGDSTGTELAFNTNTVSTGLTSAPPLQVGGSGLVITMTSPTTTPSPNSSDTPISDHGITHTFSVGTVVGICVGAFVGAGLLICLSVMMYRRTSRRPSNARSGPAASRKPRSEIWDRLGDDQDHWEGKGQMQEKGAGPMKKSPSTLKKTPSLRILAREFGSTSPSDHSDYSDPPFSSYHPNLAAELAQPPKVFMGRQEGLVASWDGSTAAPSVADDSFLSLRSVHIESGTISPSLNAAKMTPPTVISNIHRWESAEVVLPVEEDIPEASINPFVDPAPEPVRKQSISNPFFGAQDGRRPSVSRKNTPPSDPFADQPFIPRVSHAQNDSVASNGSTASGTDRAMQSLISALNLPQEEVEKRLRIASMQSMHPSELSRYSVMTGESDIYGRESMLFPSPPHAQ